MVYLQSSEYVSGDRAIHGNLPTSLRLQVLVKDELFTEKEVARFGIQKKHLRRVECSRKNVGWFFGARLPANKDKVVIL